MNEKKKPKCKLTGANGNIFNLLGLAQDVLPKEEGEKMAGEVFNAKSYNEALSIIRKYVEVV